MKKLVVIAALMFGIVLAGVSLLATPTPSPVVAQQPAAPQRPLVFVPGLLGSQLCRGAANGTDIVLWGTVDAMGQFPELALGDSTDIYPCGLIREISFLGVLTQSVYGPFVDRLEQAGYRQGETLLVFDYDWRLSVLDNARNLAAFIDTHIPGHREFDIVGHSMGGLIARTYLADAADASRVTHFVSAGSPWQGSVQAVELLRNGWGLGNMLLGGLDAFRATILSFPSTFDLMPRYDGCCGAGLATEDRWEALNWTGIDDGTLPDLAEAATRQSRLHDIFAAKLPAGIDEAFVIGVDQRTPQTFALHTGTGEAQLDIVTSWEGDGTVMRDSAVLAERTTYRTSFATHDALLSEPLVQDFVLATLRNGSAAASKAVPVRERTSILTELGKAVELIGVAIDTHAPVLTAASPARLTVHLRLATRDAVDPAAIDVAITQPDGTTSIVTLVPDLAASDPANPFEQSYSGDFTTGAATGIATITAVLADSVGAPRTATVQVPVVSR